MADSYNAEEYWDKVANNIGRRHERRTVAGDDEPYYRYKRERFLQLLQQLSWKGKSVLEVGSGPGGNLAFLAQQGCTSLAGVDVSTRMIALARELLAGRNVSLTKINGRDLPFPNRSFNIVFTSTVLQHTTDESRLKQLCGEIARVAIDEVFLFERIEKKVKGHGTNLGRLCYYEKIFSDEGYDLIAVESLPIQVSYAACGFIRKAFNSRSRAEGEPLSRLSISLQQAVLPFTKILDRLLRCQRDVCLLRFKRRKENS